MWVGQAKENGSGRIIIRALYKDWIQFCWPIYKLKIYIILFGPFSILGSPRSPVELCGSFLTPSHSCVFSIHLGQMGLKITWLLSAVQERAESLPEAGKVKAPCRGLSILSLTSLLWPEGLIKYYKHWLNKVGHFHHHFQRGKWRHLTWEWYLQTQGDNLLLPTSFPLANASREQWRH